MRYTRIATAGVGQPAGSQTPVRWDPADRWPSTIANRQLCRFARPRRIARLDAPSRAAMCQENPDMECGEVATGPAFWVAYICIRTDEQVSAPALQGEPRKRIASVQITRRQQACVSTRRPTRRRTATSSHPSGGFRCIRANSTSSKNVRSVVAACVCRSNCSAKLSPADIATPSAWPVTTRSTRESDRHPSSRFHEGYRRYKLQFGGPNLRHRWCR